MQARVDAYRERAGKSGLSSLPTLPFLFLLPFIAIFVALRFVALLVWRKVVQPVHAVWARRRGTQPTPLEKFLDPPDRDR
ncbi:MAG: hypothetical protein WD208_05450 [Dehalococcoidia bacterium]